jgi:4-hydroxy-2-oxoheptanedioate aldolase
MASEPPVVNRLKQKLAAGECATAFMIAMPSVAQAQILASSGVDCLIFDMEHGAIDLPTLHAMVAATRGTAATPTARVPWTEPWLAKPVLDTGVLGVNFPMISSAALARASADAVRYPPAGRRGYAPSFAPVRWGMSGADYLRAANHEILNLITIEEPEAIRDLDQILAVPGIDAVAIASFDLSLSMGIPGQFEHPDLRRLVTEAEAKILRAGLPLGGVALTADAARAKLAAGYRLLLVGFDVLMVEQAARAAVGFVQEAGG